MNMAEDRAGYVVEQGRHGRDLHQPEEPADRGLRLRPVRLRRERATRMTDPGRRHDPTPSTTSVDDAACTPPTAPPAASDPPAARARSTARSARSRTTSCAWARSSRTRSARRSTRWSTTTPRRRSTVIMGDGRINEAQREVSALITRTIATQQPVARDLRFLLTLDHVSYELERMGDHAGVRRQAGAQARARAAARATTCDLPRDGRARRRAGRTASCARSSTSTRRRPRGGRRSTTRSTSCTTRSSTRSSS